MTTALAIAESGFEVHLVERSGALGGNLHHVYFVAEGQNPQRLLRDLVNRTVAHENIHLHLHSEVIQHGGSVGDAVRAHAARVLVADAHAGLNACIHHQRVLAQVLAAGIDHFAGQGRHDRSQTGAAEVFGTETRMG